MTVVLSIWTGFVLLAMLSSDNVKTLCQLPPKYHPWEPMFFEDFFSRSMYGENWGR